MRNILYRIAQVVVLVAVASSFAHADNFMYFKKKAAAGGGGCTTVYASEAGTAAPSTVAMDGTSRRYIGAIFNSSTNGTTICAVKLPLYKVGAPTYNVQVQIWTDNGSNLPGTLVSNATSNTISATTLGNVVITGDNTAAFITFTFATPPTLAGTNTLYHVALYGDAAGTGTDKVAWTTTGTGTREFIAKGTVTPVWSAHSTTSAADFQVLSQ